MIISLQNAELAFILSAVILSFFNLYLQFLKWKIVASSLMGLNNPAQIWASLFCGFSAGIITPLRIGEYAGRGIMLEDYNIKEVLAATFIDKLYPLFIVIIMGGFSSLAYLVFIKAVEPGIIFLILVIMIILALVLSGSKKINKKYRQAAAILFNKINILKKLDKIFTLKVTSISLLFYCCFIIQFALLIAAFSGNTNYFDFIWAGNLVMFSKTIIPPVSLGDLGIREGASVFFMGQFGVSSIAALNASLFLFFINVLLPSLVGIISFLKKKNA